jgi:tetratricopeptide (TPR) repeat protein
MYMTGGQFKEAAKWIEQALTINPNTLNDYNNLCECYKRIGDRPAMIRTVNRASTYYEQFLALHPDDQNWRSNYMFMLDVVDRHADSKREAERLLLMTDIHVRINTMIAAILARHGDVERAVESLRADARKGFFDVNDMRTDTHCWQNIQALPNFEELLAELGAIAKDANG